MGALTLYSGVMYVIDGVRLMRGVKSDEAAAEPGAQDEPAEPATKSRGTAGQHVQS